MTVTTRSAAGRLDRLRNVNDFFDDPFEDEVCLVQGSRAVAASSSVTCSSVALEMPAAFEHGRNVASLMSPTYNGVVVVNCFSQIIEHRSPASIWYAWAGAARSATSAAAAALPLKRRMLGMPTMIRGPSLMTF